LAQHSNVNTTVNYYVANPFSRLQIKDLDFDTMIDIKNDAYVDRMMEKMKNNGEVENEYITDEEENEDSEDSDY
jgi:hypothetical protein